MRRMLSFLIIIGIACAATADSQLVPGSRLSHSAQAPIAIRLYLEPSTGSYFHVPLIFRETSDNALLNTAPLLPQGRTVYISKAQMSDIQSLIAESIFSWEWNSTTTAFEPFMGLEPSQRLQIAVLYSPAGMASGYVARDETCGKLAAFDIPLKSEPRALWEAQLFRFDYGCSVPLFRRDRYPDHDKQ